MSSIEPIRRNPLVIDGNSLSSGSRSTTFSTGSPASLLRSYLIFVRDLRGQRREPSIELRTDDVAVIAAHLGVSQEYVLGGLLDLMGATRAQRSSMMAMLAAGALTVVLTGSFVSDLSSDGVSVDMTRLAEAVQAAATGSDTAQASTSASATETAARASAVAARATVAPGASAVTTDATDGPTNEATGPTASGETTSELVRDTPRPDVLRSAATAAVADESDASSTEPTGEQAGDEHPGSATQEPTSVAIAPDGSLVASVAPPVPAVPDEPIATAELPDGSTVGVAAPPVPPAPPPPPDEPVATAELPDGTVVGVAAPPVPPPVPPPPPPPPSDG